MSNASESIARVVAVAATTVTVLAGMLPGPAVATDAGATHVVAQDGSGDFGTIGEALAAAGDGDRVLVQPGTYEEAVTIDHGVTVVGDGPRTDIVISWSDGSTPVVTVAAIDAVLSGVTLAGDESFVHLVDGSSTLHDLHMDHVGRDYRPSATCHALFGPDSCNAIAVRIDGGVVTFRDNDLDGPGAVSVHGGATALIEDNTMTGGAHVYLEAPSDATVVRGNRITDPAPAGVALYTTGRPLIEGNIIEGSPAAAIAVGVLRQPGIEPLIRGNTLVGNATGIELTPGAQPTIEANELRENTTAMVLPGFDGLVVDNLMVDNPTGVFLMQGAPTLRGNTITGAKVGLGLGSDAAIPILDGNTICGNEINVNLIFGAEMPDTTGDEICP